MYNVVYFLVSLNSGVSQVQLLIDKWLQVKMTKLHKQRGEKTLESQNCAGAPNYNSQPTCKTI